VLPSAEPLLMEAGRTATRASSDMSPRLLRAPGAFADLLCIGHQSERHMLASSPSATEIERLVVRWLGELTGFGAGSPDSH